MKIWLDDLRAPPDGWSWAKTVQEAEDLLAKTEKDEEISISFDHDLGYQEKTGYDLAKFIEYQTALGREWNVVHWQVHSMNPVGAEKIIQAMRNI